MLQAGEIERQLNGSLEPRWLEIVFNDNAGDSKEQIWFPADFSGEVDRRAEVRLVLRKIIPKATFTVPRPAVEAVALDENPYEYMQALLLSAFGERGIVQLTNFGFSLPHFYIFPLVDEYKKGDVLYMIVEDLQYTRKGLFLGDNIDLLLQYIYTPQELIQLTQAYDRMYVNYLQYTAFIRGQGEEGVFWCDVVPDVFWDKQTGELISYDLEPWVFCPQDDPQFFYERVVLVLQDSVRKIGAIKHKAGALDAGDVCFEQLLGVIKGGLIDQCRIDSSGVSFDFVTQVVADSIGWY